VVQIMVCRRPMMSLIVPMAIAPTITPTRPADEISAAVLGVSPSSAP
jgi:hypothetical protein